MSLKLIAISCAAFSLLASEALAQANHNTTRSNKTQSIASPGDNVSEEAKDRKWTYKQAHKMCVKANADSANLDACAKWVLANQAELRASAVAGGEFGGKISARWSK